MKKNGKLIFSALSFIISFVIYLFTLAPDLNFTDAGELAGVCATLGIAHPTGYPLFTILGFVWSHIPLPFTKIYQMNLFAAFTTSVSVAVFFNVCLLIFEYFDVLSKKQLKSKKPKSIITTETVTTISNSMPHLLIALISSLVYALSNVVWSISNSIEVYSLEAAIMTLILYTFLKALLSNEKTDRYLLMTAFLFGLGFSNHMTTILLVPAVLFLYFKRPGEKFDFSNQTLKYLALLAVPFLIGLSFHLYLPLRAATLPEFNWGWVSRNFDKYIYHVTGKQYQVWMFTGSEAFMGNLTKFFNIFPYQFGWLGLISFIFGIYKVFISSKDIFWFLILLVIGCLAYSLNYSIHDIETYFLAAVIGLLLFSAVGLKAIYEYYPKVLPAFILLPLISLAVNFNDVNESDNRLVPEYTRILSENLQPNALIISSQWDYYCSAFWYKQRVEGYRKDIVLVEKELLRRTWYLEQFRRWYPQTAKLSEGKMNTYLEQLELFESGSNYNPALIQKRFIDMINSFIDNNYGKRPIYVTLEILQNEQDADIGAGYEKIPVGLAFRLEKGEKAKQVYTVNVDKFNLDLFLKGPKNRNDNHLVKGIKDLTAYNLTNLGRYALVNNQIDAARKAFRLAVRINPENEVAQQGIRQLGQ